MKQYIDYLNEISPEELFDGLLGYGLFAEKIPNLFTSDGLLNYFKSYSTITFMKSGHDYVRYSSMRNTGIIRHFAIPNPIAYAYLCECLRDNWQNNIIPYFQQVTSAQEFCFSQIHLQKTTDDHSLFHMNLPYAEKDQQTKTFCEQLIIGKHFKVSTDISNCFPSIYSHSIPWALVGKPTAKLNKNNDNMWYNQLDIKSRYVKNNETNGLLIGPHTSNLISEIVLSRVDEQMIISGYKYVRNIDDCVFYADTYEEAQKFILDYTKVLNAYDLKINEKKTKIEKLPFVDEDWITQLNCFYIGSDKTNEGKTILYKNRLVALINFSKKLATEYDNLSVYLYTLKMIQNVYLGLSAKEYLINCFHQFVLQYTYLAPYLEKYVYDNFNVEPERIKHISKDLLIEGLRTNNFEACSYAIYWSLRYNFEIEYDGLLEKVTDSKDCVFMLISYLLAKRKKDKSLIKAYEELAKKMFDDLDRFWYFIYEVLPTSNVTQ